MIASSAHLSYLKPESTVGRKTTHKTRKPPKVLIHWAKAWHVTAFLGQHHSQDKWSCFVSSWALKLILFKARSKNVPVLHNF